MFVLLGIILSIAALADLDQEEKKGSFFFKVLFLILTLMLCFRYGQGTDYYPYQLQYENIDISASLLINSLYHGETGWYMLMSVFKRLDCSFYLFFACVALVSMWGMYRAINRYSSHKCLSLLILYPTYYMTYLYSAVRQGLVVSLFLAYGLDMLKQKKFVSYYILVFILSLFHTSALILIFLPLLIKLKGKTPFFWFAVAFCMMIIFGFTGILNSIAMRFGVVRYLKFTVSIPAIAVRLLLGYCVIRMQQVINQYEQDEDEDEANLYYIYIAGLIIYITFSFTGTFSQRLTMPMKAVELLLIPMQVSLLSRIQNAGHKLPLLRFGFIRRSIPAIPVLVIAVLNFELIKNIDSYIVQGNYFDWVNPLNYPYISIFDGDRIFEYISEFKL